MPVPVNPQIEALLEMVAQGPAVDFATISPGELRALLDQPMQMGPPPAMARVEAVSLALKGRTLEARLYVPEDAGEAPPLTLYLHGGGWVIGTLDTHDGTCRALAQESGSALLSLAYRLAPEHAYPAPLDDAYDSLVWLRAHAAELGCDGSRLAVAGDSAGGNLAAACAILSRDRGGPVLRHQLLLYPVTDRDYGTPSYVANGGGNYYLSQEGMDWFWRHYLAGRADDDAPLALINRSTTLEALASATVITAEFDPLRDEGMAYAARLQAAGVQVESYVAEGMIHGFFSMFEAVPDAWPHIRRAGAALRQALN